MRPLFPGLPLYSLNLPHRLLHHQFRLLFHHKLDSLFLNLRILICIHKQNQISVIPVSPFNLLQNFFKKSTEKSDITIPMVRNVRFFIDWAAAFG